MTPCSVAGCTRRVHCRELCSTHYSRLLRRGTTEIDRNLPARGTGRHFDGVYFRVKVPGHPLATDRFGWVAEHRIVAWDTYGPFDPAMQVHHINEDRTDNRPENLQVMSRSEHRQLHLSATRKVDPGEARRLYESGLGITTIARHFGASPTTVRGVLIGLGVSLRPRQARGAA